MAPTTTDSARRRRVAFAAAALLALAVAAPATAADRTVRDPRFDVPYLTKHGRLDITRASADRKRSRVTHAVKMRARVKPARRRERPAIILNTRGGKRSDYELIVFGSTVFAVPRKGRPEPVARATLNANGRTWRYRFDLDDVPGLGRRYGWAAVTQKRGGRFADVAPDGGYARSR